MSVKKSSQTPINSKTAVLKSRKRTSLQEFALLNDLRPEVTAGFKAWLKGELHHFDDEWEELFKQYQNRTL